MKIVFAEQSLVSLDEAINFYQENRGLSKDKILKIYDGVFDRVNSLKLNPHIGQIEEKLEHLEYAYRRLIFKHFKIIYRIEDNIIFITDVFDSRQSPLKMKGYFKNK